MPKGKNNQNIFFLLPTTIHPGFIEMEGAGISDVSKGWNVLLQNELPP